MLVANGYIRYLELAHTSFLTQITLQMFTTNSACLDVAREQTEFIGELKVILEQEYEPSDKNIRKKVSPHSFARQIHLNIVLVPSKSDGTAAN